MTEKIKRLVLKKTDYMDWINKSVDVQSPGATQKYTRKIIKENCGKGAILKLNCDTGKILKYLMRMEVNRIKKLKKAKVAYTMNIIKCENNVCKLDKEYINKLILEVNSNVDNIITKIKTYQGNDKITLNDLQNIFGLSSKIVAPNIVAPNIVVPNTIVSVQSDGTADQVVVPVQAGGKACCSITTLIAVTANNAADLLRGRITFAQSFVRTLLLISFCVVCDGSTVNYILKTQLTDRLETIKTKFSEFNSQIQSVENVEVNSICVTVDNCMEKKDSRFLKQVLEKMESVFDQVGE